MTDNNLNPLPFTEFTAGGRTFLLRLTALSAARLEERLGMSVYKAVQRSDEVRVIAELLYSLIEGLRPEFSKSDTFALIDDFISEGGSLAALNSCIAEALRSSGFFGAGTAASPTSPAN